MNALLRISALVVVLSLGILLTGCEHVMLVHVFKDDSNVENGKLEGHDYYTEADAPYMIIVQKNNPNVEPKVTFELVAQSKDKLVGINYVVQNCGPFGNDTCKTVAWGCKYGYSVDAAGHPVYAELIRFNRTSKLCGDQGEGNPLIIDFNKGQLLKLKVKAVKLNGPPKEFETFYQVF